MENNIVTVPVITSIEEATVIMSRIEEDEIAIGKEINKFNEAESKLEEQLKNLRNEYLEKLENFKVKTKGNIDGLFRYAEENRAILTKKSKTVNFQEKGKIGWRWNNPGVKFSATTEEIVAKLKELKLRDYIKTIETIKKNLILQDPEKLKKVKEISVVQKEKFFVRTKLSESEKSLKYLYERTSAEKVIVGVKATP